MEANSSSELSAQKVFQVWPACGSVEHIPLPPSLSLPGHKFFKVIADPSVEASSNSEHHVSPMWLLGSIAKSFKAEMEDLSSKGMKYSLVINNVEYPAVSAHLDTENSLNRLKVPTETVTQLSERWDELRTQAQKGAVKTTNVMCFLVGFGSDGAELTEVDYSAIW